MSNPVTLIIIVLVYLGVIAYLGFLGYRKTKSASDYLLAGRNTHPFIMALSYGATFISTSAIVGFGGMAAGFGLSLLWLTVCNIGVGIFIAFVFFGKRMRRIGLNLDAHTFPEFLGRRTNSRFIQIFTGIVIFIFMPIYTAAVLIGAARIIEVLMKIPFEWGVIFFTILVGAYVIMGGLKGVMYTDALQGSLMLLGMLTLLIFTFVKLGGIGEAHRALAALSPQIPEDFLKGGITSWTGSPKLMTPLGLTIFTSIVAGVGIGVLVQPQLVVRFMTVKSNRELNQAVTIGSIFILSTVGAAFIVGALSNVYFFNNFGQVAFVFAEKNFDKVIPTFIDKTMPVWFSYLFLLVILSAAMSTLSSQFHAIGTAVGRDVLEYGFMRGKLSSKKKNLATLVTRIGIVIALILTVVLSLTLTRGFGEGIIARATAIFFGLMASGFLAPYIASVYWKRLTKKGSIAGILSGFSVAIFCFLFTHGKEAAFLGLSKVLFGKDVILGGLWTFVDPLIIAIPVSAAVTVLVTLFTKQSEEMKKITEKCFEGV